jgi:hypothetical protein
VRYFPPGASARVERACAGVKAAAQIAARAIQHLFRELQAIGLDALTIHNVRNNCLTFLIKLDRGLFPRETPAECGKKSKMCVYAGPLSQMKTCKIILVELGVAVIASGPVGVVEREAARFTGVQLEAVISISSGAVGEPIGHDDTVEAVSDLPRSNCQSPALSGVPGVPNEFADGFDSAPFDLAVVADVPEL